MSTPVITIGSRLVGAGHPCYVIAEVGVNHNGSLDEAKRLVDVAARAGADAVKFQKRTLTKLYSEEMLANPNLAEQAFQYIIPLLQQFELTDDQFLELHEYCVAQGIQFLCTPWDEDSVEFLEKLEVPVYKLGSPDLTNLPLIDLIVEKGKPLILSTGMSSWEEIEHTARHLDERGASYAMLHCNSTYPAPFEDVNLKMIDRLREFGAPVGYSGHERGIAVSTVAVALGACILEKHITLDRTMIGPDHAASLEPAGFDKMMRDIRVVEMAMGDGVKRVSTKEMQNREVLGKSLAAKVPIAAGTVITADMMKVIGPGKGLSPQRVNELIGHSTKRAMAPDELFYEFDLEEGPREWIVPAFHRAWGFKTRFTDVEEFARLKPTLVEHHFSDRDLQEPHPDVQLDQRLYVHAPEFWGPRIIDLCSAHEETRELAIDVLNKTLDKVREIAPHYEGSPTLVVHVGGMTMDDPDAKTASMYDRALEAMGRLDTRGVTILPENLPPRPWYFGGQWCQNAFIHPEEIADFCRRLNVKMCFDICHAQLYCNWAGRQLCDYIEIVRPYIAHIHVSDAAGIAAEGLQIGEGMIDFTAAFEQLHGLEYSWVPEIWRGHNNNNEGFAIALKRLAPYAKLL
ncbi:MAG: N-acetylneuraminate synthase family protein [Acidobacteriota bacterium]|nr:N-acetylneuraminate synthase family protein [Acidobacteriota bacterium]